MQKLFVSISLCCSFIVLASFTGSPVLYTTAVYETPSHNDDLSIGNATSILYNELNLEEKGLSQKAFEYAYKGYLKLKAQNKIPNIGYLTICDLSQSSKNKRLYLIDLHSNTIVMNTWVAHGRNSGAEFATRFSNKPSSLQSSLGFYVTGQTYNGEHGLSLRIAGLEPGFNDKAYKRGIVIHGADYIGTGKLNCSYIGRSYGCPAVSKKESKLLIQTIKNGTCLFIYNPAKNYLKRSKILND